MEGVYGQVSDLEIQANEIQRVRRLMESTLARHGQPGRRQIRVDIERDKILTADEARDYGIVDEVLSYRKLSASRLSGVKVAPVRRAGACPPDPPM